MHSDALFYHKKIDAASTALCPINLRAETFPRTRGSTVRDCYSMSILPVDQLDPLVKAHEFVHV